MARSSAVAVLALASLPLVSSEIAAHAVSSLPGWDHPLPSRQFSGFISAEESPTPGHERYLHYVFVEAENDPVNAPVVLWTNGGPGCSSLEGYMMEMGPLRPDPTDPLGQRLTRNPWTWNLNANMLYLEHGVGVGFSYSNGGDVTLNDEIDANDAHWFLRNFFHAPAGSAGFNEYASNEFFLTGESYAGIYIPGIANQVRLGNIDHPTAKINIIGFMIGNGCSGKETFNCGDPPDNTEFIKSSGGMVLDFLHGHGLVGRDLFNDITDTCTAPKPDWGYDAQCSGLTQVEMCGLSIQEFVDQYYNAASCMGPIPEQYLGQNWTSSGHWAEVEDGSTIAGYTADYFNSAWNTSLWPDIRDADPNFTSLHGLTSTNVWRMDAPGADLHPRPIPMLDANGSPLNNEQFIWPTQPGGPTDQDPLGRPTNVVCCAKYQSALDRMGLIDIYNIDDQSCTAGSLLAEDKQNAQRSKNNLHKAKSGQRKGGYADAMGSNSARRLLAGEQAAKQANAAEPLRDLDACGGASFNIPYFNRQDVQAALNVDTQGPVTGAAEIGGFGGPETCQYANDGECDAGTFCPVGSDVADCPDSTGWAWAECADAPWFNYTKTVVSHTPLYQQYLAPEMRITIFSGDADACVPYLGTMRWVADVAHNSDSAAWPVVGDAWVSWTVDDNVAGYFTAYDVNSLGNHNFTFATVKGAGHMVPEVKPKSALSLFYR